MSIAKVNIYACNVAECDMISGSPGNVRLHFGKAHDIFGAHDYVNPVKIEVRLQRNDDDAIEVVDHD